MRIETGRVVRGKIEIDGEPLDEGAVVTVIAVDDDASVHLRPEDEDELLLAIAEIDSGQTISGEQLLDGLRRTGS